MQKKELISTIHHTFFKRYGYRRQSLWIAGGTDSPARHVRDGLAGEGRPEDHPAPRVHPQTVARAQAPHPRLVRGTLDLDQDDVAEVATDGHMDEPRTTALDPGPDGRIDHHPHFEGVVAPLVLLRRSGRGQTQGHDQSSDCRQGESFHFGHDVLLGLGLVWLKN